MGLKSERKAYRPGETVRLSIDVRDGLKRPHVAQVVLMAVDEAVLQLTGFRLPDPFHRLLHTPAIDVRADDLRATLALFEDSGGASGLGPREHWPRRVGHHRPRGKRDWVMGGAAGDWAVAARSARASPPPLGTRPSSPTTRARRGPPSSCPTISTRYRIMAFAVDGARAAGTGRTSVRVALPLSTLPVLPRLLRVGDEASAGVMIQNQSMPAGYARSSPKRGVRPGPLGDDP